jgi:hypothetical protein
MEHVDKSMVVEIIVLEVTHLHELCEKYVVVCRFNGYWPPTLSLYKWIDSSWKNKCEISLFSKGFFYFAVL